MHWINLEVRTLRSPEYLGSDPVDRATWLNVLAHCCEQENGGRIAGAAEWTDRQWQQVCGVTRREVLRASQLLTWDGPTLCVAFFPADKEKQVQELRRHGEEAARRRWRRKLIPQGIPCGIPQGMGKAVPCGDAEGKGREMEGEEERKEKEKERKTTSTPDPFEGFWERYPRKIGKGNAEKVWRRRKCGAIAPEIMAALERARSSFDWTKEGGQFVPYPATWLSRDGWKDEYTAAAGPAGLGVKRECLQLPIVDL
jgi:hypothetical protein